MNLDEKISIVEAIIFSSGEPIERERICEAAQLEGEIADRLVRLLNDRYESTNSALRILNLSSL